MARIVKVAIAGSGLTGLTAAWLLMRPTKNQDVKFEVHIFEKHNSLGMDAASMSLIDEQSKEQWRVDVPLRAFQGGYYPQLISMYKKLGVRIREADFTYSLALFTPSGPNSKRKITSTFIYNGLSGRAGFGKPSSLGKMFKGTAFTGFFMQLWSWLVFAFMTLETIFCFLVSAIYAAPFFRSADIENKSFGEWADEATPRNLLARLIGLDCAWRSYVRDIMVPMYSAMCTATSEDILSYPAVDFLGERSLFHICYRIGLKLILIPDLIWLTIGTHHYLLANGVREVVAALSKDLKNVHLSAPITSITLDPKAPHLASITYLKPSGEEHTLHGFDHVVFATEAKTAAAILTSWASSLSEKFSLPVRDFKENILKQAEALGKFHYTTSIVVNHTDDTLLPDDPRDCRELNLIYYHGQELGNSEKHPDRDSSVCVSSSFTMATHTLTRPEGYPAHLPDVYQSTNPYIPPKKGTILSVARMQRAVPTVEARKALQGFCEEKERKWWQCPAVASTKPGPLQGAGRMTGARTPGIWVCGSYAFFGIPLLEGCVVSAKNVAMQGIMACEGTELKEEPWAV
ncbi:hypothetical protein AN958_04804 [Leucoagaricus sp. SymC.cos]|nr:hypothetical protein AN958_04804 [Leucoagaricus sp. SymC.cos]